MNRKCTNNPSAEKTGQKKNAGPLCELWPYGVIALYSHCKSANGPKVIDNFIHNNILVLVCRRSISTRDMSQSSSLGRPFFHSSTAITSRRRVDFRFRCERRACAMKDGRCRWRPDVDDEAKWRPRWPALLQPSRPQSVA